MPGLLCTVSQRALREITRSTHSRTLDCATHTKPNESYHGYNSSTHRCYLDAFPGRVLDRQTGILSTRLRHTVCTNTLCIMAVFVLLSHFVVLRFGMPHTRPSRTFFVDYLPRVSLHLTICHVGQRTRYGFQGRR